jgi:MFS family permease
MTVEATSAAQPRPWTGMGRFARVWLGGTVSVFGTVLSGFALGVWVYQKTGSATDFALITFFNLLPGALLAPFVGAIVDRFDRRTILIAGDIAAAVISLVTLALLSAGRLEVWMIYGLVAVTSISNVFQMVAFEASLSFLIDRRHFARAHGMMHFGTAGAQVLAPPVAAVLVGLIGINWVVFIDFLTFLFGMGMLFTITLPAPPRTAPPAGLGGLLRNAFAGWPYIRARPGLVGLVIYLAVLNMLWRLGTVLMTPLVLSFSTPTQLGFVVSVAGVGTLIGGFLISAWGGPKRRVAGFLALTPLMALGFFVAGWRSSVPWIAAGVCLFSLAVPLINASYLALWQVKVAPEIQGRVFAMRRMVFQLTAPLAYLAAGPLADRVFEPLLAAGGPLAPSLGVLLGTGKGRGIGLLFIAIGIAFLALTAASLLQPRLRRVESELPDALPPTAPA